MCQVIINKIPSNHFYQDDYCIVSFHVGKYYNIGHSHTAAKLIQGIMDLGDGNSFCFAILEAGMVMIDLRTDG